MLDQSQLDVLPDAPNIIFMAGMKFGSTANSALTWAMNVELPAMVCRRFPASRFAVFSTGNVYPLVPIVGGGSIETNPPEPVGEYAVSCVGRERVFQGHSDTPGALVSIVRLSYAVEMRYGVIVDIAEKVMNGEPIDLVMGNFCAIWQSDANAMALQSLACASTPPCIVNVTGPEILSVRQIALRFGEIFNKPVLFTGSESGNALISNTQKMQGLFGYPTVPVETVIRRTAAWVSQGGESLSKPTHFQTTDGRF
jgi:nucleoside-diphosphate-sugar epimerase